MVKGSTGYFSTYGCSYNVLSSGLERSIETNFQKNGYLPNEKEVDIILLVLSSMEDFMEHFLVPQGIIAIIVQAFNSFLQHLSG